jgi:Family of unknown function (DUF5336)
MTTRLDQRGYHRVSSSLWAVVAILGVTTYAVSFGASVVMDFPVRLAVLAAAVAAVGLLPRQGGRGWITVALAVTGSLDALANWMAVSSPGWAQSVIFVLNALQSLAAVAALLGETRASRSTSVDGQDYSTYANFAAAYQAYVMQYQQAPMHYYAAGQASGQASAAAQAAAVATGASTDASRQSEALRSRYAPYGGQSTAEGIGNPHGQPTAAPPADPGLPDTIYGVPQPHSYPPQQRQPGAASST